MHEIWEWKCMSHDITVELAVRENVCVLDLWAEFLISE